MRRVSLCVCVCVCAFPRPSTTRNKCTKSTQYPRRRPEAAAPTQHHTDITHFWCDWIIISLYETSVSFSSVRFPTFSRRVVCWKLPSSSSSQHIHLRYQNTQTTETTANTAGDLHRLFGAYSHHSLIDSAPIPTHSCKYTYVRVLCIASGFRTYGMCV